MNVSDSQIKTSGTAVFNGNYLNLRAEKVEVGFVTQASVPFLPGAGSLSEVDWIGFKNPTITVEGTFDASVSHATNTTGSNIDFFFLKDLQSTPQKKVFYDDVYSSGGSTFYCHIQNVQSSRDASKQPARNVVSSNIPYTLTLVIDSGLW